MNISQTCPPKGGRFMEHSVDVTDKVTRHNAASPLCSQSYSSGGANVHVLCGSSLGPQKSGPQTVSQDGQLNPPPLESQVQRPNH